MIETQVIFVVWCVVCLIMGYRYGYRAGTRIGVKHTTNMFVRALKNEMVDSLTDEQIKDVLSKILENKTKTGS